jgi:2-polyprenyl-3-methyl-5-hydroxy-6-metoxy-1,4-benzoquinol methylase
METRDTPTTFVVPALLDNEAGSLRDAVARANDEAANPGPDVIQFGPAVQGKTINLLTFSNPTASTLVVPQPAGPSALLITSSITIQGTGETITRGSTAGFRLFQVTAGGGLTLSNLTLSNGLARGGVGAPGGGGAAGLGGAIYNQGRLEILGTTLVGNTAEGAVGGPTGGDFRGFGGGGLGQAGVDGGGPNGGVAGGADPGFGGGGGGGNLGLGRAAQNGGFGGGSGVGLGGAVFSQGSLTITGRTLTGNQTAGGANENGLGAGLPSGGAVGSPVPPNGRGGPGQAGGFGGRGGAGGAGSSLLEFGVGGPGGFGDGSGSERHPGPGGVGRVFGRPAGRGVRRRVARRDTGQADGRLLRVRRRLRNGAFVAAGDVDGDGLADLAFGGVPGGAPRITLGITKGLRVLDLGCGVGTTALPAARLGAEVLGVDIARNLVEAGNRRAREQGLTSCGFQEGDASDLRGLGDRTFDLVVSIFGAMFAPEPFDVAREMERVTRSGGRIVMGNWIPGDPTLVAQVLKISSAYTPPPPESFVSPMTWGGSRAT